MSAQHHIDIGRRIYLLITAHSHFYLSLLPSPLIYINVTFDLVSQRPKKLDDLNY